jgi:hypothetical protein
LRLSCAHPTRLIFLSFPFLSSRPLIAIQAHVGEEKGFLAKYGLDDWKFALPIGILVGMPVVSNEVYVMNAETHIVVAFLIFIYTMYSQTGAMIAKSLDEQRDAIFNQLKAVDESLLTDLKASIQANEKVLELETDVASIFKLTDDLHVAQADALNHAEQHKYREAIVKKLDSLVSMEEAATAAIRNRMLTTVKADVVSVFAKDAGAKEKALAQAIAVLTAGQGAKIGKDVVGEAFGSAIKNYREKYAKLPAGADEILVNLEKEMQAVAAAPAVEVKGGNVYEAFPILRKK